MAVTGLKQTSSVVAIGFSVDEAVPGTFAQASVDLNLSPLDREVFVVLAINLDPFNPECIVGINTKTSASLTTTSQTAVQNLSNSNCLSAMTNAIRSSATTSVGLQSQAGETPPATLEYIGIIATNDFFVQVQGTGNIGVTGCDGKLYGYRARADASIFAALVQSEVLSA